MPASSFLARYSRYALTLGQLYALPLYRTYIPELSLFTKCKRHEYFIPKVSYNRLWIRNVIAYNRLWISNSLNVRIFEYDFEILYFGRNLSERFIFFRFENLSKILPTPPRDLRSNNLRSCSNRSRYRDHPVCTRYCLRTDYVKIDERKDTCSSSFLSPDAD